jgi:hypothetical protein
MQAGTQAGPYAETARGESVENEDYSEAAGGWYSEGGGGPLDDAAGAEMEGGLAASELRARIGGLVEDHLVASMGGWGTSDGNEANFMAKQDDQRREAFAEARAAATRAKHARDERRPSASEKEAPDDLLRRQRAEMEGQMVRKEREVRAALKRNRAAQRDAQRDRQAAATGRPQAHRQRRDELFRNDVAAAVDERMALEARRGGSEAEDLASEAVAAELASHREAQAEVAALVRSVAFSQASTERRLAAAHAGALKLSRRDGVGLDAAVEDLVAAHAQQRRQLDAAHSQLAHATRRLRQSTARHPTASSKHLEALAVAAADLAADLRAREEAHTHLAGQLSVAQMTANAMRAVLRDY